VRRTRPKGDPDPGWERISWDQALDEAAAVLRRIAAESGPEAVAFGVTTSSGTALSDAQPWVDRLINAFGSPNNCNSMEICAWHRQFARAFTTGTGIGMPDYRNRWFADSPLEERRFEPPVSLRAEPIFLHDSGGRAQGFDGTWVMCKDPHSDKAMSIYSEPQLVCAPWKLTDQKFPGE
jgi:hypothetical protein